MNDNQYIQEKLRAAIATVRAMADDAELDTEDERLSPLERIERLTHALAWSHAHAMQSVCSAQGSYRRSIERQTVNTAPTRTVKKA